MFLVCGVFRDDIFHCLHQMKNGDFEKKCLGRLCVRGGLRVFPLCMSFMRKARAEVELCVFGFEWK